MYCFSLPFLRLVFEQRNSPAGECKSNDGPMNQVYPHSIHEPIADHQRPGDIFCKPRI